MKDLARRFTTVKGKRFAGVMNERLAQLHDQILNNGKEGIRNQWMLANEMNNKNIDGYLASVKVSDALQKSFRSPNLSALNAFIDRTEKGMNLSDRVWNFTDGVKDSMEGLISKGVLEGKSAITLSKELKQYVNGKPIRYEGTLIPGKNLNWQAIRLAATEMNMAFRTSDYLQNSRLPFVSGVTINLSPSHPVEDICFTSWNYKLFTTDGWRQLNKIKIGDLVLTHRGRFKKVNKIYKSTTYEVKKTEIQFKYAYDSRAETYKIAATDNHPFMINGNWKAISEIRIGDKIKMLSVKCKWCGKPIPFDRNYCSKSCVSKGITKKQWANPEHKKNLSQKRNKVIRENNGKIPWLREWVASGGNTKNFTNPENIAKTRLITSKRMSEQSRNGTHPFQRIETTKKANQSAGRNKTNSFIERKIEWLLKEKGIVHEHSYIFNRKEKRLNGQQRFYVIDFVIPEYKIAIECDGEYWHDKRKDADKIRQQEIEKAGFTFLRFPGEQIRHNLKSCSESIDRLMANHNGEYEFMEIEITAIRHYTQKQRTPITKWNFGIEEDNSYVINGFVVHNCDELAGDYPKGFMFTGWHPLCICYATWDTLSKEDFVKYIKTGEINQSRFTTGIPGKAQAYLEKNGERLLGYKNPPYWLRDNFTKDLALREVVQTPIMAKPVPMVPEVAQQTVEEYLDTLPSGESELLYKYTAGRYRPINIYLRKGNIPSKFGTTKKQLLNEIDMISQTINNAPKYVGEVERGIRFHEYYGLTEFKKLKDELQIGNIFTDKGFMSSTIDKTIIPEFTSEVGNSVIFKIKSKNGINISSISKLPKEKEVIFNKNSVFKIKKVIKKTSQYDYLQLIVEMEEL